MRSLAVIGTGIAGMACAYLLRHRYHITVYEKNDYVGGHTNTVYLDDGVDKVPVDTGFMVYNDHTYPNLIRFFDHLGVEAMDTSMSFSVNDVSSSFETSFTNLSNFFPSVGSWFETDRYSLLIGLKKLFKQAKKALAQDEESTQTLAEFIDEHRIDELTTNRFLLPMTAAIWSTPTDRMLDYPALTLFRFLNNHGMLGFGEQFQWKTLVGGSDQYKKKVLREIGNGIQLSNAAVRVCEKPDCAEVVDHRGEKARFDEVIIATHADEALQLLEHPSERQQNLLAAFNYNENPVILHSDTSVMPNRKRAWASWNYRYDKIAGDAKGSTHYWMNKLQNVSERENYFVSVDYDGPLDETAIHWRKTYHHPRFDQAAIAAQPHLPSLNESGPIRFCGSYFRYGFHEDAFTSALNLSTQLSEGNSPLA